MKSSAFRLHAASTLVFASLLAVATAPLSARAATYTWDGGGLDANVTDGANWQGNAAPPSDGSAQVVFTDSLFTSSHTDLTPNLDGSFTVDSLTFAGGSSFTLGSTSHSVLDIGKDGLNQNSTAAQTITVPTFLTVNQTWTFASGAGALNFSGDGQIYNQGHNLTVNAQGTNTLNGIIFGSGGLTVNGTGTVTLTRTNSYTGGTALNAGTLNVGSAQALGTSGALSFAGGTLQYSAASAGTDFSGRFSTAGNQAISLDTNGQNIVLGTGIVGTGTSLTKLGAGTLTLTQSNSYTGATTIGAGTLDLVAGASVNTPAAALTVDGPAAAGATFTQSGGTLATGTSYVGTADNGVGVFNQTGGTHTVGAGSGTLALGYQAATSSGTYNLSGTGSLSTGAAYVGYNGAGTFTQSGGTFSTGAASFYLGYGKGGSGTYTLSGSGSLSTGDFTAGYNGTGSFTQSGGAVSTGNFYVGRDAGGSFTQSGGTVTTNGSSLFLGYDKGSSGTYALSSAGSLSTGAAYVGDVGTGSFTQSGGSFTTNGNPLYFGYAPGSSGTYLLGGGTLTTGSVQGSSGKSTFDFNGGTLQAGASSTTFFQELTTANVQAGGAVVDTDGYNVTIGQALLHDTTNGAPATDGGLTKLGAGTLTLSGTNTFAGPTTVSAGTLTLASTNALQDSTLTSSGSAVVFDSTVSGNSFTVGGLTGTGNLALQNNAATPQGIALSVGGNNADTSYGGILSGSGTLIKTGTGTLNLTGSNTYTGGTTLAAGALGLGSGGALGSSGTLSFTGGTLQFSSANSTDYSARFSSAGNQAISLDTNGQNVVLGTGFGGTGTSLTKLGAGTLTLTGTNTYTGATTVNAGVLQAKFTNSLPGYNTAGEVTINVGGTLAANVGGAGEWTEANLNTLLANATFNTGSSLGIDTTDAGGNFTYMSNFAGNLSLTKLGAGTLTLTGANSQLSSTTVMAGTLAIVPGSQLNTGNLTVGQGSQGVTGTVTQTGGTVTTRNVSLEGGIASPNGTYNLSGLGQLNATNLFVGGINGSTGTFNQTGGTVTISPASPNNTVEVNNASVYNLSAGTLTTPNLSVGYNGSSFNQSGGAVAVGSLSVSGSGTSTYQLSDGGNGSQLTASAIIVGDGGSTSAFVQTGGTNTVNGTLTLGNTNTSTGSYTLSGGVLAVNNVTTSGTGNFYFNGGTLRANSSINSFVTVFPYVQAGGAIIDTNGYTVQIASIYHDPALGNSTLDGGLTKIGLGTLKLSGNLSSYTGGTAINGGTLELLDPNALGSKGIISFGGGTLEYANLVSADLSSRFSNGPNQAYSIAVNNTPVTFSSALTSNGGSLTKLGPGGLVLNANNTFTGPTTISAGDLELALSQALKNSPVVVTPGGTLSFGSGVGLFTIGGLSGSGNVSLVDLAGQGITLTTRNTTSATYAGVLSGAGSFTQMGSGTTIFTGANTYTGGTTVSGGTLLVANTSGSATGTGAVTVRNGAVFGGTGTSGGAVTVQNGGTLSPGINSPGRLTLTSTLSLNSGSGLTIELGGLTAGTQYDQVFVNGQITLGSNLNVSVVDGFNLAVGQSFNILVDTGSSVTGGTFTNAVGGTLYTDGRGDTFLINYAANADGGTIPNDVQLTVTSVVPEPSTWALLGLGAGLLGLVTLRPRRPPGLKPARRPDTFNQPDTTAPMQTNTTTASLRRALAVAAAALSLGTLGASHARAQANLTFSGGNGQPFTLTLNAPVTYVVTTAAASGTGPFFDFQGVGSIDASHAGTSTLTYTINAGTPRTINQIGSDGSFGSVAPTDFYLLSYGSLPGVAVGDVVVIDAGSVTTSMATSGATLASGSFQTFLVDNSGNRLSALNGVSVVPEPGTWTLLLAGGVGMLAGVRRARFPRRA